MIFISENKIIPPQNLSLFRLENSTGAYVEVLNYGATLVSLVVPDKQGNFTNMILSYDNIESYFTDTFYIGSTIGRFANRIAGAQFLLNGKIVHLDKNDGKNSNHGGFNGFHTKIFDAEIADDQLILSCESNDGEGGFPGNMKFSVIYSFTENNELHIEYKAVSDKETPFNPTNHAYFNLSVGKENILNHELKVYAGSYLETDDEFIPTGSILPITDPGFDFREYATISEQMIFKDEIIKGYNTYFISNSNEKLKRLASLQDKKSGRAIDVYSTMPGVQIYTGDYLSGKFRPFSGICLEAQFYPDAPNHAHFEGCMLDPGKEVRHKIVMAIGNSH